MSANNLKRFTGAFVDLGEDMNFYVPEEKGKRDTLSTSLFVDDTIKTIDVAMAEIKKKTSPYWVNAEPQVAAFVDEVGESFFFYLNEELKERVVIFEFMDIFMPHTLRGLAYNREWLKRYEGAGLSIIGIYNSPFAFDKNLELLQTEIHRLGIHYPVLIDHDFAAWRALENRYWPRRVLFNNQQEIIADYIGAAGYRDMEQKIQEALRQISPGLACPRLLDSLHPGDEIRADAGITAPQFFGFKRGELANADELSTEGNDVIFTLPDPKQMKEGQLYLCGPWLGTQNSVYLSAAPYTKGQFQGDSSITLTFKGSSAYVLCAMRNYQNTDASSAITAQILLDDKPVKEQCRGADLKSMNGKKNSIVIHQPKLHEVVQGAAPGQTHRLDIVLPPTAGDHFEIFAIYVTD